MKKIIYFAILIVSLGVNLYLICLGSYRRSSPSNNGQTKLFKYKTKFETEWFEYVSEYENLEPHLRKYFFNTHRSIALMSDLSIYAHEDKNLCYIVIRFIVPSDMTDEEISIELTNGKSFLPINIKKSNTVENNIEIIELNFLVEESSLRDNSLYINAYGSKEKIVSYFGMSKAIEMINMSGREAEFSLYGL